MRMPALFLLLLTGMIQMLITPQEAFGQNEIQKLTELKKKVWMPWVMNPANNACIEYTASLGMKYENGLAICNVGDMVLINALLCHSGDRVACGNVVLSQDDKGKFHRSRMHADPSLHSFGSTYPGSAESFSRDHMLGVLLYLVSDPDKARARRVATRWNNWLEKEAVVTPQDLVQFADKIGKDVIREATNAANCVGRSACWKESVVESWEDLSREEKIACGIIVVASPIVGIACPSIIKNGKKLVKKEEGPGILTTFLPHVCEGDESRCIVTPAVYSLMSRVWSHLGLTRSPNMILFNDFETEQQIVDNIGTSKKGSDRHLLAIKGMIRQAIGQPSAKIFGRFNSLEGHNPFYQYLFNKYNNRVTPWSTIAANVLAHCPDDLMGKDPSQSQAWLWLKADPFAEKDDASLWDCIFMANLLQIEEINTPLPTQPVYEWEPTYRYCFLVNPYKKVSNSFCGKPDRILEVENSFCRVWLNGELKLLDRGKEDCPAAQGSGTTYNWSGHYCYTLPDFKKVTNSFCGQPAKFLKVEEGTCSIFVDGEFTKLLSRGEEDCPARENNGSANYLWLEDMNACQNMTTSEFVANSFCGKPKRTIQIEETYCSAYEDGAYLGVILPGDQDCPGESGSSQPKPDSVNQVEKFVWESPQETGQPNSSTCNKYSNGNFAGAVPNHYCGKQKRLLTVHPSYCTAYVDGSYDAVVLRGVDDCPAK